MTSENRNQSNPETSVFNVPEITCSGCANAIENSLQRLEAVCGVDVEIDAKRVRVRHLPDLPPDAIIGALELAGFTAIKAEDSGETAANKVF